MINEVFAKKFFPHQNPLGKRFSLKLGKSAGGDLTVVGVATNGRYSSLKRAAPAVTYFSYLQTLQTPDAVFFELCTAGNPRALAQTVRKVVRRLKRTKGSHRQFRHPQKGSVVTVPGQLGTDLPAGTLKAILRSAQLEGNQED